MTRRNVTVTVEFGGSVKTDDDVKMTLTDDSLPENWSVKRVFVPTVDVELMVPRDVSKEDAQKMLNSVMAGKDAAQNFGDEAGSRGETAQTVGMGQKIKKG